jgi:hypothetical protein
MVSSSAFRKVGDQRLVYGRATDVEDVQDVEAVEEIHLDLLDILSLYRLTLFGMLARFARMQRRPGRRIAGWKAFPGCLVDCIPVLRSLLLRPGLAFRCGASFRLALLSRWTHWTFAPAELGGASERS